MGGRPPSLGTRLHILLLPSTCLSQCCLPTPIPLPSDPLCMPLCLELGNLLPGPRKLWQQIPVTCNLQLHFIQRPCPELGLPEVLQAFLDPYHSPTLALLFEYGHLDISIMPIYVHACISIGLKLISLTYLLTSLVCRLEVSIWGKALIDNVGRPMLPAS